MADDLSVCPDYTGRGYPTCQGKVTFDEPVWFSLAEVIERTADIPKGPWQELMALAQILHDLRINDTNELCLKLGAVYVYDDRKPLHGEYHYAGGEKRDRDRHYSELGRGNPPKSGKKSNDVRDAVGELIDRAFKKPRLNNRRQAIMAQKERKNEGS